MSSTLVPVPEATRVNSDSSAGWTLHARVSVLGACRVLDLHESLQFPSPPAPYIRGSSHLNRARAASNQARVSRPRVPLLMCVAEDDTCVWNSLMDILRACNVHMTKVARFRTSRPFYLDQLLAACRVRCHLLCQAVHHEVGAEHCGSEQTTKAEEDVVAERRILHPPSRHRLSRVAERG